MAAVFWLRQQTTNIVPHNPLMLCDRPREEWVEEGSNSIAQGADICNQVQKQLKKHPQLESSAACGISLAWISPGKKNYEHQPVTATANTEFFSH